MGNNLQPSQGPLQKSYRRQQDTLSPGVESLKHVADQAHIMEKWQPADDDGLFRLSKGSAYHTFVAEYVLMIDHHAFRQSSRARCVLKKGQRVSLRSRLLPFFSQVIFDNVDGSQR